MFESGGGEVGREEGAGDGRKDEKDAEPARNEAGGGGGGVARERGVLNPDLCFFLGGGDGARGGWKKRGGGWKKSGRVRD